MPVHRPGPIRPRRLFLVALLLTAFSLLHPAAVSAAEVPETPEAPEATATWPAAPPTWEWAS